MTDLENEANKHAISLGYYAPSTPIARPSFIAGANSNYVKQQIDKAKAHGYNIGFDDANTTRENQIRELQNELKTVKQQVIKGKIEVLEPYVEFAHVRENIKILKAELKQLEK